MKKIYKGPLRSVVVSKIEVCDGAVHLLEYETPIVKKDLQFYDGIFNTYISFEYGTRILDEADAMGYVCDAIKRRGNYEPPYPVYNFVNSDEIVYDQSLTNEQFKSLKRTYKAMNSDKKKK